MTTLARLMRLGTQGLAALSIVTVIVILFYTTTSTSNTSDTADVYTNREPHSEKTEENKEPSLREMIADIKQMYEDKLKARQAKRGDENNKLSNLPNLENEEKPKNEEKVQRESKTKYSKGTDDKISDSKENVNNGKQDPKSGSRHGESDTGAVVSNQAKEEDKPAPAPMDKEEDKPAPVDKASNRTRYLIYLCDRHKPCGGWGDRQKGIPAAYVMALVTGRRFGVNMSYPCDIKLLYVPNEINWYVKVNDIKGLSWEIVDWMDNRKKNVEMVSDFNAQHPSDVVFLRTNQDVVLRIAHSKRYGDLVPKEYNVKNSWPIIWKKLMKPSIHLEEHVDWFMTKVPTGKNLVCAHVRMRKNPSIPNDSPAINSLSTIDKLWDFLAQYEETAGKVFIASDSMEVRDRGRKRFGAKELDTNGVVLHIDRQGKWDGACKAFEMVLLEQAVLARCNVLVLTWSGLSIRANMMSDLKQETYVFMNGTVAKFKCRGC